MMNESQDEWSEQQAGNLIYNDKNENLFEFTEESLQGDPGTGPVKPETDRANKFKTDDELMKSDKNDHASGPELSPVEELPTTSVVDSKRQTNVLLKEKMYLPAGRRPDAGAGTTFVTMPAFVTQDGHQQPNLNSAPGAFPVRGGLPGGGTHDGVSAGNHPIRGTVSMPRLETPDEESGFEEVVLQNDTEYASHIATAELVEQHPRTQQTQSHSFEETNVVQADIVPKPRNAWMVGGGFLIIVVVGLVVLAVLLTTRSGNPPLPSTPAPSPVSVESPMTVACRFIQVPNITLCQAQLRVLSAAGDTIPSEIGLLTQMTHLDLTQRRLTGSIPASLGELTRLTFLDLAANGLVGSIPPSVGNLTELWKMGMEDNSLSGSIPSSLGNLVSNLIVLDLTRNQLTGTIPSELGNLAQLTYLDVSANQLRGSFPERLGNLTRLRALYLFENNNSLTGSIPSSICSNGAIEEIITDCFGLTCETGCCITPCQ